MNELINKTRFYTVKQVAEQYGVSKESIKQIVRKLFPTKMQNGKTTWLSEEEVTLISKSLKNPYHTSQMSNLQASLVGSTSTRLEIIANYKAASDALAKMLEEENALLKQENENLQIQLDESKEWYSIKRMELLNPGREFDWRLLKNESKKLGIELRKAFDQNYGEVNTYHISVWESLFFDTINYE